MDAENSIFFREILQATTNKLHRKLHHGGGCIYENV
jgi:hypothetical protein